MKILVFLTQDQFKKLIELTQKTKQAYSEKWQETREKLEQSHRESTGTLYADIVRLFPSDWEILVKTFICQADVMKQSTPETVTFY